MTMINNFFFFKYLSFNKKNFLANLDKNYNNPIVLCEISNLKLFSLSHSFFLKSLSEFYGAKVCSFYINFTFYDFIKNFIKKILNPFSVYYIYKSFSNEVFFFNFIKSNGSIKNFSRIKNNFDLINLKFKDMQIGDCIYDDYLTRFKVPTIDIESNHFKKYLKVYEGFISFWDNFFIKNNVKSLVVSHSVYLPGLLSRIGLIHNCSVFVISPSSHYRLTKKNFIKWSDQHYYPKFFKKIKPKTKKILINLAKRNLYLRFRGQNDARYKLSNAIQPVFKNIKFSKKIKFNYSKNVNILISSHCLTDAPHVYGKMLFSDFTKWLDFLGYLSHKDKFNQCKWFLKPHPAFYDNETKIYKKISEKFKNIEILPKNTTHDYLIRDVKIDLVLTVYGSIAYEYPLFNIPVINAGHNPCMGYNFALTPSSIKEYKAVLNKIYSIKKNQNINTKKNIKKIYEFYAMHHLIDYNLLNDFKISTQNISDYNDLKNYKIFLKNITTEKYLKILKKYNIFIKSNSRRLLFDKLNDINY
jgi:hypothetical protein